MARRSLSVLILAAAVLAAGCKSLWLYYPAKMTPGEGMPRVPENREEIRFGPKGASLFAYWMPAKAPRFTILFCHGNAGNVSSHGRKAAFLHSRGFSVLIFDYRGYGASEGSVSETNMYEDARAAWRELTEVRKVPPDRIIVWGNSLGGPVAARLASETKPAGLVLESTFYSLGRMARENASCLGRIIVSENSFNTAASLSQVRCPVLVVHSRTDETVPFAHGNDLFTAAKGSKLFLEINGSHNRGFFESRGLIAPELARFLKMLPQ